MTKTIMFQGTASEVGKSILAAACCRFFARQGYKVTPFKAQNMSLNSYICADGSEVAMAQAVQAAAAQVKPTVQMSPILLKPNADDDSQVILLGKIYKNMQADQYFSEHNFFLKVVKQALIELSENFDLIVLEGGGSPAEINLKNKDLVNMKSAELANAPVILIADIDKGGIFAAVIGTFELLTEKERKRIKGIIINKFRGDPADFADGVKIIEARTGKKVLGVMPYLKELSLPAENSLTTRVFKQSEHQLDLVVIAYPQLANFTDFDYFKFMPGISLRFISSAAEFGQPDLIILPGSKTTIKSLNFLYQTGLADLICQAAKVGKMIIGICAGYQMLGKEISDPDQQESVIKQQTGLNLLPLRTELSSEKITSQVQAFDLGNLPFSKADQFTKLTAYEIHQGRSTLSKESKQLFKIKRFKSTAKSLADNKKAYLSGAINKAGNVWGTYLHDIFRNDEFRSALINYLRLKKGLKPLPNIESADFLREKNYNYLADKFSQYLDLDLLNKIINKEV